MEVPRDDRRRRYALLVADEPPGRLGVSLLASAARCLNPCLKRDRIRPYGPCADAARAA